MNIHGTLAEETEGLKCHICKKVFEDFFYWAIHVSTHHQRTFGVAKTITDIGWSADWVVDDMKHPVMSNPDAEIRLMTEEQAIEYDRKMIQMAEIKETY